MWNAQYDGYEIMTPICWRSRCDSACHQVHNLLGKLRLDSWHKESAFANIHWMKVMLSVFNILVNSCASSFSSVWFIIKPRFVFLFFKKVGICFRVSHPHTTPTRRGKLNQGVLSWHGLITSCCVTHPVFNPYCFVLISKSNAPNCLLTVLVWKTPFGVLLTVT